jgi:hypothetical protein
MTDEEKSKHDVIEAVFYDDEKGYGSKLNILRHAIQINKDITMDDISKLMNKDSFRSKKGDNKEEEDETVKGGELAHLCASGGCSGLQSGGNCKQHMTTHRHAQLHARHATPAVAACESRSETRLRRSCCSLARLDLPSLASSCAPRGNCG